MNPQHATRISILMIFWSKISFEGVVNRFGGTLGQKLPKSYQKPPKLSKPHFPGSRLLFVDFSPKSKTPIWDFSLPCRAFEYLSSDGSNFRGKVGAHPVFGVFVKSTFFHRFPPKFLHFGKNLFELKVWLKGHVLSPS